MTTWRRSVLGAAAGLLILALVGCGGHAVLNVSGPIESKTFPVLVDEAEVLKPTGLSGAKTSRIGAFTMVPSCRQKDPSVTDSRDPNR